MEYGKLFGCYTIAYNPRACNVSPPPRAEQWSTHLIRANQLRARIDICNLIWMLPISVGYPRECEVIPYT